MEKEPKAEANVSKRTLEELHTKWENALEGDMSNFNKCMAFAKYLIEKHGEEKARNHRLLHLLMGSTPPRETPCTEYDFPGDDSIEKFINEL
ncbi:MAG: hypothetical protein HQ536_00940 [Parcubacteria group bacterium]|nr:hypothetical protein [Parcubacteria group bacterium]